MSQTPPLEAPAIDLQQTAWAGVEAAAQHGETPDSVIDQAVMAVPRGAFLLAEPAGVAHDEMHLATTPGSTMPPLESLARMLRALQLTSDASVLEVGTGSGYTAALLSQMTGSVVTIEKKRPRAKRAVRRLEALAIENATVVVGDGRGGWPKGAPFDAIVVSVARDGIPNALLQQLRPGGRLVAPLTIGDEIRLTRIRHRPDGTYTKEDLGPIRMVSRIGDILVEMRAISRTDLEAAFQRGRAGGKRLGELLLSEGLCEESDIYRALALQHRVKYGSVDALIALADAQLVNRVSRRFLDNQQLIPLRVAGGIGTVATVHPTAALSQLGGMLGVKQLDIYLISPTAYRRLWTLFDLSARTPVARRAEVAADEPPIDDATEPEEVDVRYIELFEAILLDAVAERCTDIHLERFDDEVRVRYRIDGEMHDLTRFWMTPRDLIGVVNVIKINAELDISERRLPQGGRIRRTVGRKSYDLRVQTQPALHGEHVIIRLLPQQTKLLTIEDLGFSSSQAHYYRRLLVCPTGLVLVVGPTGSGKSTTLYAGLQLLTQDKARKVITAEDPIEYSIKGIQQSQVRPDLGFGFDMALRSFLRQDPDIIMVGEIRDPETALEAIRASQTGHLVISTLHCNNAIDAVQRLVDLGMHPNSIASELLAVVAQRLGRRICVSCRRSTQPEPEIMDELFPQGAPDDFRCYVGEGCARCAGYGTFGRVAVSEFFTVDSDVRRSISEGFSIEKLRDVAYDTGMVPLRKHAISLVMRGVIPLSEVPRILSVEQMSPRGYRRARETAARVQA